MDARVKIESTKKDVEQATKYRKNKLYFCDVLSTSVKVKSTSSDSESSLNPSPPLSSPSPGHSESESKSYHSRSC